MPQPQPTSTPSLPPAESAPPGDPPPYSHPPASGYRIALTTTSPFPPLQSTLSPCSWDADRESPIFFGSAIFARSVHPCKIAPRLQPSCRVPYAGREYEHHGRYDLLPFIPAMMELVPTSRGLIPEDRHPIEGGYEETGEKLYHAMGSVNGIMVPGKTAEHLGGCNLPFGGGEHVLRENYSILCWKQDVIS
ncbi:hypothetical protein SISNIDRAFT_460118 [Sistotremastrum niveocremeum HHB9708]|uniref:Uncharacterized protein n=2 Tax=Sistotremastraceae TaxID=3402574 RepID=A0A164NV21_9AGAM|nr:hypothetical protein SISNIDRAFT_460118 [Sistotremastrum niveocremeum HHB9708]KZT40507.1 hypothetical protein SISSUDRAFT_1044232 [Sistotremastrum suecicum HHB10207 ss-3]